MVPQMGLSGRAKAGYTPLVVLLTPPGVELCLDGNATLCSANGALPTPLPGCLQPQLHRLFCSYHSQAGLNGGRLRGPAVDRLVA